ncbi:MAG TPA: helix-turn-helix transcriptional regulator [Bordetella sp.]
MEERQKTALIKAIGKTIAAKRDVAGLSQEAVAEALGISREAVSRIETGVTVPSIVRLAELAEIMDCEMEALIVDASSRLRDQARHIAELLDDLEQDQRDIIVSVVKQIASGFKARP